VPELPTAPELLERRRRGAALVRDDDGSAGARVAVLSTYNLDLLPPFLAEALDRHAVPALARLTGFGQLARLVADPASELYEAEPQTVLLAPAVEDLLLPLYEQGAGVDGVTLADERVDELVGQIETLLGGLPGATVVVALLPARRAPRERVLSAVASGRGQDAVARLEQGARELGRLGPRVVVIDLAWAVREHGWTALWDSRMWFLGRMRLNAAGHALLADLVAGHLAAARGVRRAKVVAVDLDDTLWGGVVGEVGASGIEIGREGVGLAFRELQRELLVLHQGGVLLAMCSKNDPEYALAAFDHPDMLLRREDFVAERVNWEDKASNMRALADELNLGLDAFAFLDDNAREREWIRQALPEVMVLELPDDPARRPDIVARAPCFQALTVTQDDRHRAESYRAQAERRRTRGTARSFDDYLVSLEQRVCVEPVVERTLQRAVQLCQRTNQFNLLTRRHTAADLERMLADPAHDVIGVMVADRFGDSGMTGLAIVARDGDQAEIDTLLLSCRVLGRHVEDALLSVVARRAWDGGARRLIGRYASTDRNGQVAKFFPDRGFAEVSEGVWRLDLKAGSMPPAPDHILIEEATHA